MRCFIAFLLPERVTEAIVARIEELDHQFRSQHLESPRWERAENLHCTLNFFGEIQRVVSHEFMSLARERMLGKDFRTQISVTRLGAFPASHEARILWVGLEDPTGALNTLQQLLAECATEAGISLPNEHAFHPHITIGRWKEPHYRSALLNAALSQTFDAGYVDMNEIVLMKSDTQPAGSVYTVLDRLVCDARHRPR